VQEHRGADASGPAYKRLILSHHKHLNRGDFLVDDGLAAGADQFEGELIKFLTSLFPNWNTVTPYLLERAGDEPRSLGARTGGVTASPQREVLDRARK
jgi:hypothetical protein